ncbi:hypothetical protein [Metabacillus malikii]|uniref:Uncharacterized protein n=1 Tax=Metabacillus malikii TaxID=1504265 RepID=A0ABT9ZAH3_9BACI|nr:hypothetical protein [Metabacillus malikii]MDQ0229217.1 hypothetical protein [Metabacillus malikii]
MNFNQENIEQDIKNIKMRTKRGCLIFVAILALIIILPIGKFIYDAEYREYPLIVSHSPSNTNTIEVVEVGSPWFFTSSKVKIKYKSIHINRPLHNDGVGISNENVMVDWKSDYEATITLYGDKQEPDTVEFTARDKNNKDKPSFRVNNTD